MSVTKALRFLPLLSALALFAPASKGISKQANPIVKVKAGETRILLARDLKSAIVKNSRIAKAEIVEPNVYEIRGLKKGSTRLVIREGETDLIVDLIVEGKNSGRRSNKIKLSSSK